MVSYVIVSLFRHFRREGKVLNISLRSQQEHLIVSSTLYKPLLKRRSTGILMVRVSPRDRLKALVQFGPLTFQAALGRGGVTSFKREGDGGTPRARMAVLSGFRKGGMLTPDRAGLKLRRAGGRDGWCDAPGHGRYNRPVRLPFPASHETLLRNDVLYDFGFVLDWNIRSRRRGMGSAIFLHIARADYAPTEGCVALAEADLRRLLARCGSETILRVELA